MLLNCATDALFIICCNFQIGKLLQIYLVAPVSSASAERSFSTLRRTKTWLRSTQGQDRLTALASMQIEHEILEGLDMQQIIAQFSTRAERRLNFS
jgi:hypothetical protein